MKKGCILSVDDDPNLQNVITHYLTDDGYTVLTAGDTKSALDKASTSSLDVILLDLVLPDGEGLSLIPQLRSKSQAAVIVVSGKSDTTEKIICLEMGADDYITKPFEMRELSARIKAVLRRMDSQTEAPTAINQGDSNLIKFGDGWQLDRSQYQLFNSEGQSADLTTGEFKLLEALILSPNRALSRDHLFELTREGEFDAFDRAIDIQIARLRKKLGQADDTAQLIKTVRGVGYMFTGKIEHT